MQKYIEKLQLSASTNGRPIALSASHATMHTATSTAGEIDEIMVYVSNPNSTAYTLTLRINGVDVLAQEIAANSGMLLVASYLLNGGEVLQAKASTASMLHLSGVVHRYTEA